MNLEWTHSRTVLSLTRQPIQYCRKYLFPLWWNLRRIDLRFFIRVVTFSSFIRLWSFRRFLFTVKFWGADCRKEKADLAHFGQSKIALVSLFADPTPGSFDSSSWTLQTHLKATTEHFFSIAAIMWHSALSLITLVLSCEQGLLIFLRSSRLSEKRFRLLGTFIPLQRNKAPRELRKSVLLGNLPNYTFRLKLTSIWLKYSVQIRLARKIRHTLDTSTVNNNEQWPTHSFAEECFEINKKHGLCINFHSIAPVYVEISVNYVYALNNYYKGYRVPFFTLTIDFGTWR